MGTPQSARQVDWTLRCAIAALLVAVAVLIVSFFFTPRKSGIPASFGNIFQPLAYLAALAATIVALLINLPLLATIIARQRREGARGVSSIAALIVSVLLLIANVSQFMFALFGPDI